MVICGVIASSATSRASIPTGVPRAPIVKREERATQICAISSVRAAAAAASPPKKAATAGAAARAIPPRPVHSITAESPMSSAASPAENPSRRSVS